MEYSKRDADLLDIVTSVPEFVESNNSTDVRTVLGRSGVLSRAVRLLHSFAMNDKVANNSVCMACLESILVLAPCSTETIEQGIYEIDPLILPILVSTCTYDKPMQLQADNDIAQLAFCAISNVVLRRAYELENCAKMTDEDEFQTQAERLTSAVSDIMLTLRGTFAGHGWGHTRTRWNPWKLFRIDHYLFSWADGFMMDWTPTSSAMVFCDALRTFRSAWVTAWMKYHFSSSLPFHRLTWGSLFDGVTHLEAFPCSTRESEQGIFMMTDECFRMPRGSDLLALFSIYSMVLYGKQSSLSRYTRRHLHMHFARRAHVCGGNLPEILDGVVEVPFVKYTVIINELASFVPGFAVTSKQYAWHKRRLPVESAEFQDASAIAIRKMIHCRRRKATRRGELSVILDTHHLNAVRTIRRYSRIWRRLIDRTAEEFGYILQIEDHYNIDMHAELQFYAPDTFLYDVLELREGMWETSHYYDSDDADDWGRLDEDPTFRPDAW